MSKKNTPDEEAAAIAAQEHRIERNALDFAEDFLAGKATIEFRPLDNHEVGEEPTLFGGFTIRLVPGRAAE